MLACVAAVRLKRCHLCAMKFTCTTANQYRVSVAHNPGVCMVRFNIDMRLTARDIMLFALIREPEACDPTTAGTPSIYGYGSICMYGMHCAAAADAATCGVQHEPLARYAAMQQTSGIPLHSHTLLPYKWRSTLRRFVCALCRMSYTFMPCTTAVTAVL